MKCNKEINKNEIKKEWIKCNNDEYLVEGKCTKYEYIKDTIISYTCPDDYILNNDTKKCSKLLTKKAKVIKECPFGYSLKSGKCSKTVTTSVKTTYYCEDADVTDGYKLNVKNCVKALYEEPTKQNICEDENYELIDNKCILFKKESIEE